MKKILLSFLLVVYATDLYAQPCGSGFSANGTDDFITIPNTDAVNLQNTRNRTIEFWFRTSDINTRQVLYEEGAQVNVLYLYIENGLIHSGGYRNNANIAADRRLFRSGPGEIVADTWYHIALVLSDDGTNFDFLWYLDGVLRDQQAGVQINQHSGNVSIGRNGGGIRFPNTTNWVTGSVGGFTSETYNDTFTGRDDNDYNFSGEFSLFRIWNTPRTQTEIDTNKDVFLDTGTDLVAYMENGQMQYTSNGFSTIDAAASGNGNNTSFTWVGGTNNDWTTASNWSGSNVPDATKLQTVVVQSSANPPQITTERRVGQLTIESGATVEVLAGGTLNVFYGMTNDGTVEVMNNGSFLYNSCDDASIAGAGDFIVHRDSPNYSQQDLTSFWSSPVVEADSDLQATFGNIAYKAFIWQASSNPSRWVQVGNGHFMPAGVGVIVRPDNSTGVETRTFQGTVNNGDIDVFMYRNGPDDNYNLLGNPYPSAIDWIAVYNDNQDILDSTIEYWNQTFVGVVNSESDFIQYTAGTGSNPPGATQYIATAQSVFARTSSAANIKLKNTHRVVANNDQFFRGNAKGRSETEDRAWIRISGNNRTTTILVGFLEGATDGHDAAFDGAFNNEGANLEFYSFIGTDKYSIQGRNPDLTVENIVPIGIQALNVGEHTLSIDQEYLIPEADIILEDMLLGTYTDLRQSGYTFNIDATTELNDRFQLRFGNSEVLSVGDEAQFNDAQFSVSVIGDQLMLNLNNDDSVKEMAIYDMSGKKILVASSSTAYLGSLSQGVYIVRATLQSGAIGTKKFVR